MGKQIVNDEQLLRYSRQIMLPQLDYAGQEKLLASSVLIVGLGGLGSPVAIYLAAAGVGKLILNDFDNVDLSNLQRQIVHDTASIGSNKAISAQQQLQKLNPDCETKVIAEQLQEAELTTEIDSVDVVVDCTDNFSSRQLLNKLCVATKTPLVSAAAIRFEGQLTVFHNQSDEDACYCCLYQDIGDESLNCSESGVLAPIVGVLGSLQALEVIKLITAVGDSLQNQLLIYDGLTQQSRIVKFSKDSRCAVCA